MNKVEGLESRYNVIGNITNGINLINQLLIK